MSGRAPIVTSIVVDFDGTICEQDVSEELLQAFAPAAWWDIDLEFRRGEIGSRECLTRQAALLSGTRDELLRFAVDRYPIEPSFAPFVEWARESGIEPVVASDGMGFYVEPMLRTAGIDGLRRAHEHRDSDRDHHHDHRGYDAATPPLRLAHTVPLPR